MANIAVELFESVLELTVSFAEIALMSPFQAVLLAVGGLLTAVAVAGFGYLAVGAVLAPFGVQLPTPGRGTEETDSPRPPGIE